LLSTVAEISAEVSHCMEHLVLEK